MPMNTPQAKNAVVACCSHSHGWPMVRVTTSKKTHRVKPPMQTPHRTINPASSGSSHFHFRWRWRWRISALLAAKSVTPATCRLLHRAYEPKNPDGMRPELRGQLVLDGRGGLH